jgi:hypothetical protein
MKFSLALLLCAVIVLATVVNGESLRGSYQAEDSSPEIIPVETLIGSMSRRLQAKFNRFRSYQNEKVKPSMYSKRSRHHDVSEYLSPNQKYMVSHQKKDSPDVMFRSGWSGFDKTGR